ncbi:MAG TPA: hypothetical protein DD670_19600 [Planctomycetaceae bacterium]|nr:hypothetical protein [Planctomycetaceae bacterium]
MILKNREKLLVWLTLSLLAVVLLQYVFSVFRGPRGTLSKQLESVTAALERDENRLKNAKAAASALEEARRRSLPADPELARSLYQDWLLKRAYDADFAKPAIEATDKTKHKDIYHALRFTLNADASLAGLTRFLHDFYGAGYAHQIVSLTITPDDRSDKLKVRMIIEALSLEGAASKDQLAKVDSKRKLASLDDYRKAIGERNLFAAYTPPAPSRPPRPETPPKPKTPSFDAVRHVYVTGVTAGEKPQVWIVSRTTDRQFRLFEGEEARIEGLKCRILKIHLDRREVELEIDGRRYVVALGESLRDAKEQKDE